MARHDLRTKPEWLHQQELREARRQSKKHRPQPQAARPAFEGTRTLVLVIKDRSPANLQLCYMRLKDDLVSSYARKFRYHEPRQLAVMRGAITLPDLPAELYTSILSHMNAGGKGWCQGSMAKDSNEEGLDGTPR
jgi:hypothetical protein